MGAYFDDWMMGEEGEEEVSTDPFDGLGKRDQDTFFKVLDLVPDGQREQAMDYFLDHPSKIKAIVAAVKKKKALIENKDTSGLQQLFAEEKVAFQQADLALAGLSNNDY